jgi:DNA-binding response OmpR family regulator
MSREKILIVNPDPKKQKYLSDILEKEGYTVLASSTSKDGFDLARRKKPHLILSSHQAEKIDGIDFCYMIRNHNRISTTPFLLYVTYIPWNERLNAYQIGVNDIISESVREDELLARISAALHYFTLLT